MSISSRLMRVPRLGVPAVLAAGLLLGLVGPSPSASAEVTDPGGSGASASTTIGCDSQSHQLSVNTTAYSTEEGTVIMRRIWVRLRQSSTWHVFYAGAVDRAGWEGVSSTTSEVDDVSALAGDQLVFAVEYSFSSLIETDVPRTYAWETPALEYYDPSTGGWYSGTYCAV